MNECCAISDLPESTPSMKSTSHFGESNGDEPGFGSKDDACRRGALENGVAPHVAGGSRRARPAAPTAPARSGSNFLQSERVHVPWRLRPMTAASKLRQTRSSSHRGYAREL